MQEAAFAVHSPSCQLWRWEEDVLGQLRKGDMGVGEAWRLGSGDRKVTSSDRSLCCVQGTEKAGMHSDGLSTRLQTRLTVFLMQGGFCFVFLFCFVFKYRFLQFLLDLLSQTGQW